MHVAANPWFPIRNLEWIKKPAPEIPGHARKMNQLTQSRLTSLSLADGWATRSRAILGSLDILVDIGVPAEKEVIQ
jgi:hypothetical protein